jgi:SAM-dependent methyltransferase
VLEGIASFVNLELPLWPTCADGGLSLAEELSGFCQFGKKSICEGVKYTTAEGVREVPSFTNEFWPAKQRQFNSLHGVPHRACFKPQLVRFFIKRLSQPGDRVLDPFGGRGTTAMEAALMGRLPYTNDINPLSLMLIDPRLRPPGLPELAARLQQITLAYHDTVREDLLAFFEPNTLRDIYGLRKYFLDRQADGTWDDVDRWLRLVTLTRLSGHSSGYLSVRTLPPNQAVSPESQIRINAKLNQTPPQRDVREIIMAKSRLLLRDATPDVRRTLAAVADHAVLLNSPADRLSAISDNSVDLVVTSPPFLDVVDYAKDNWLRCWFVGIDAASVRFTVLRRLDEWALAMTSALREIHRVLKPGGHAAFEVGEVHGGKTKLEETVLPCGVAAGLLPTLVMIHQHRFTKTAHCWGMHNNSPVMGTNTNQIVVFRKPDVEPALGGVPGHRPSCPEYQSIP